MKGMMGLTEFWESILEAVGLSLLKVAITAVIQARQIKSSDKHGQAQQVVCVEVPPAISQSGGTLEVHWVGATRVAPGEVDSEGLVKEDLIKEDLIK